MVENVTTLNEIRNRMAAGELPSLTDLIYAVRGTGSNRDKAFTLEEVRNIINTLIEISGTDTQKTEMTEEGVKVSQNGAGYAKSAKLTEDGLEIRVSSSYGGGILLINSEGVSFKQLDETLLGQLKKDGLYLGNAHLKLSSGDDSTLIISSLNSPNYTAFKNSKITSSNQGKTTEIDGSNVDLSNSAYEYANVQLYIDSDGIVHFDIRGKETNNAKYLSFNTNDGKLTAGHNYTNDIQISQLINGLLFAQKEGTGSLSSWNNRVVVNADFDVDGNIIGDDIGGGIAIYMASSSPTGSETRKVVVSTGGLSFYEVNADRTAWNLTNKISSIRGANPVIPRNYDAGNSTSISISLMDGETCFIHKNANSDGSLNSVTVTETNSRASKTMSVSATVEAVFHVCRFGNKIFWRSLE